MSREVPKSASLRRNDPCWCGSGQKYKKCHMGRENEPAFKISELGDATKRAFGKKLCLHPKASERGCEGNIIKAHTVQRTALAKIAEQGHVYTFVPNMNAVHTSDGKEHTLVPRKKGIKNASTFTGFCAKHDNETFRVIEDQQFKCCSEHAFLHGYRALCREVFQKKASLELESLFGTLDRGKPLDVQILIQRFARPFIEGTKAGYEDLLRIKNEYDKILEQRNFERIKYYAVFFEKCPDILCSGGFWPQFDFCGTVVQEPLKPSAEGMQFSIITADAGGVALFTWFRENGVSEQFVSSFASIPDTDLSDAVMRFTFEYFENTYFKASWWENLNEVHRRRLHERMAMINSLGAEHQPDCLKPENLKLVDWKVRERRTNIGGK